VRILRRRLAAAVYILVAFLFHVQCGDTCILAAGLVVGLQLFQLPTLGYVSSWWVYGEGYTLDPCFKSESSASVKWILVLLTTLG
jgi:hypothetical protein